VGELFYGMAPDALNYLCFLRFPFHYTDWITLKKFSKEKLIAG
jgi:hypothetical protein